MTADRRAEAERLAREELPLMDLSIEGEERVIALIERALIAAENAARADERERIAKMADEDAEYAEQKSKHPNLRGTGFDDLRHHEAVKFRQFARTIRALRTDAGTDAGEETGT